MILHNFKGKDSEGKTRNKSMCSCEICFNIFTRETRYVRTPLCCSKKCISIAAGTRILLKCAHCNKKYTAKQSSLSNSKSGQRFCSRKCKDEAQKYNILIQPEHYGSGESNYRKRALEHYGVKCNRCGYSNVLALEVHHISRDRTNNNISNLIKIKLVYLYKYFNKKKLN